VLARLCNEFLRNDAFFPLEPDSNAPGVNDNERPWSSRPVTKREIKTESNTALGTLKRTPGKQPSVEQQNNILYKQASKKRQPDTFKNSVSEFPDEASTKHCN
jgi:hypothetical protein